MKKAVFILIILSIFTDTYAQENGFYAEKKNPFFNFLTLSGEFKLEGNYESQKRITPNYTDYPIFSSLSAGLKLKTQSYLWHPSFLKIDLGGEINPETKNRRYQVFDDFSETRSQQRLDFKATFFDKRVVTFSTFFNYFNGRNNIENIGKIRLNNFSWGGDFRSSNKYLPFHFYYKDFKLKQENLINSRMFESEGKLAQARFNKNFSKFDSHLFRYKYTENLRNLIDYYSVFTQAHQFDLNNKVFFSRNRKSFFNSIANYRIQSGIINYKDLKVIERISISLPYRFNVSAGYSYNNFLIEDTEKSLHEIRGEVNHRLFKSLRSKLYFKNSLLDHTNYNEREFKTGVNLQYNKNIPYGKLSLNYRYEHFRHQTESNTENIYIYNEQHTLSDGNFELLDRGYVNIASIVVKDLSGSLIYQLNIDYVVIERDNFLEIQRIPGGLIENNALVLVDYFAVMPGNYAYHQNFNYIFGKLSFFERVVELTYGYIQRGFTNTFQTDFLILDYMKQHLAGVSTNWKFLNAGIEYYDRQSIVLPHTLMRYYIKSNFKIKRFAFNVNASIKQYHLTDDDIDQTYYNISGMTSVPVGSNASVNMHLGYTKQDGERIYLDMFNGRLEYSQTIRQLSYKAGIQYFKRYLTNDRFNLSGAYFSIIRRF